MANRKPKSTSDCGKNQNKSGRNRKPRNFRGKGNGNYKPDAKFVNKGDEARDASSSLNDIGWYNRNPELLASASSLPFPYKPGMRLNVGDRIITDGVGHYKTINESKIYPGIMEIEFEYTIGNSADVSSPASITAKELFAQIRRAFSGSLDEDAPDLFMYCIALDSVHAYIAYLKRIYKTINAYTPDNYLYPEALFEAQFPRGDLYSDVHMPNYMDYVSGKVQFWNYINTLVNMVNKFHVPANMDIYNRHRWMNESVYADGDYVDSQQYVFVPRSFFTIIENSATGTGLHRSSIYSAIPESGGRITIEHLYQFGVDMINALSEWDDAYTINGHIERAFEGQTFYTAALIGQDERISPVYSEEVLAQIHNLVCISDLNLGDITQNPESNAIITTATSQLGQTRLYLDVPSRKPTGAEITIASRLAPVVIDGVVYCGTEVPVALRVAYEKLDDGYVWHDITSLRFLLGNFTGSLNGVAQAESIAETLMLWSQVAAWKMAPMLPAFAAMGGTTNGFIDTVQGEPVWEPKVWHIGEVYNVTTVGNVDAANLHRICVYSEFNCFNK